MVITVQELLKQLKEQFNPYSETALLDAQVLVAHHLEKPRTWVLAHPETPLNEAKYQQVLQSVRRLDAGEPLPYILGHWEFFSLDFFITPDVLIPRPETELLVERAIRWLQSHRPQRRVVDVGTGSGCIGIAIARHIPDVHVVLGDRDSQAVDIAELNVDRHDLLDRVEVKRSDLLSQIPGSFDLICANLPYIPTQTLKKLPVAKREPRFALDGGVSGTKLIERLLKQAKGRLHSGGLILAEIDPAQAGQLIDISHKTYSSAKVQVLRDLAGRERCLEIELPLTILHLCPRQDWLNCQSRGEYRAESLGREGFIHCSSPEQITEVANRYYQGIPDMVVLRINPDKLFSEIRWVKIGKAHYPHVYGPINLEAVDKVSNINPESDGIYRHLSGK